METPQERDLNREQNPEQQYNAEQGQRQTGVDQSQRVRGEESQAGRRQEFEPVGERRQTQTMEQGSSQKGGLIGGEQMERYASQWNGIQAAFVDEPRKAVEQADQLVAQIIQDLTKTFASERQKLEGQWSRGDQVSTEDLRVALQRYRQFFQSLLRG